MKKNTYIFDAICNNAGGWFRGKLIDKTATAEVIVVAEDNVFETLNGEATVTCQVTRMDSISSLVDSYTQPEKMNVKDEPITLTNGKIIVDTFEINLTKLETGYTFVGTGGPSNMLARIFVKNIEVNGVGKLVSSEDIVVPVPDPVIPPTPDPIDPVTPVATGLTRASMFVDAAGSKFNETINLGVTSPQGWALCHGKAWENEYREDILNRLQEAGGDTLVYLVDKAYRGAVVLEMCLADRTHPEDGRHMVQSEGWYDRSVAHGIIRHVAVLRNSPDTGVGVNEQAVIDLVDAYTGTRFKEVIFSTGLETKRNTSIDQTVQLCNWFKKHAPKNRIVVGDQSKDFLLAVASKVSGIELWLEQATHPTQQPLTVDSAKAYLADMRILADKVGTSKVWAGEWWARTKVERLTITNQILSAGYNCGCGQFK